MLCDKNRLNRVLLNLISNAYKFTPEGGKVCVDFRQLKAESDEYGEYELRVKDSGIGMSPEFAQRVFEAFERERTSTVSGIQGTGLGMAITKAIVDLMGGDISVNTEKGKGTEFVIRLRFKIQEVEAPEEKELVTSEPNEEEKTVFDSKSMRILLVDDMDVNREISKMLLEGEGFPVETAVNGLEAVEKVNSSKPGYYKAVLMDIQMPVLDGYGATRAIRTLENKELASIPIIAMTANAFAEDVKKATEAGMVAHIAKPIDVDKLFETLRSILR